MTRTVSKSIIGKPAVTIFLLAFSLAASADLRWTGVKHDCISPGVGEVTARLDGIPPFQSWENTCKNHNADAAIRAYGVRGKPSRCEKDVLSTGIWGKWRNSNDSARCPSPIKWEGWNKAGCFGPDKQVFSARLMGSGDWEKDCANTDTSAVAGKTNWGTPDRCVKTATGMWGEWYRENVPCDVKLEWGTFKDNGCVKNMAAPDSNAGGISYEGKRSYSSVLWNVGGDWLQACQFATANFRAGTTSVEFEHPTACVNATADQVIGYGLAAIIGAVSGAVPIASVAVGAGVGAVVGVAGTGVTELVQSTNTNLNVWGIFWVDDATCGVIDSHPPVDDSGLVVLRTGQIVAADPAATPGDLTSDEAQARIAAANSNAPIDPCPDNAVNLRGVNRTVRCSCNRQQSVSGNVWGGGPYTDDSKICRAAVHAGVIPLSGGIIEFETAAGQSSFQGSSRNSVTTTSYGAWPGSFILRKPH